MIVLKFGGSSVGDAERILSVAAIVAERVSRRPVVVVSALGGVTDLLEAAVEAARCGEREKLEPILADLERKHRWALSGAIENPGRRHQLSLEVDGLFDDVRQRLRSIRVLGEATPRATDAVLAVGETLSARIVAAAFSDHGLAAEWVDPRQVIRTDNAFGEAEPDLEQVRERCREDLLPLIESDRIPVLGGFVGSTRAGETTTLGRGGSDTSAAVLGAALDAEEIQIWTDVDGLMSADPRYVPDARTLPRVSFAEAAELAYYGARVLHPDSIAPAVRRRIPVHVLNSLRPEGRGTVILDEAEGDDLPPLASVVSRGGACLLRARSGRMRVDPTFLPRVLAAVEDAGVAPDLVVATEVAATLLLPCAISAEEIAARLGSRIEVEVAPDRAIVCVIGSGLRSDEGFRRRVVEALTGYQAETMVLGASRSAIAAVVPESALERAVRGLHRDFLEHVETQE